MSFGAGIGGIGGEFGGGAVLRGAGGDDGPDAFALRKAASKSVLPSRSRSPPGTDARRCTCHERHGPALNRGPWTSRLRQRAWMSRRQEYTRDTPMLTQSATLPLNTGHTIAPGALGPRRIVDPSAEGGTSMDLAVDIARIHAPSIQRRFRCHDARVRVSPWPIFRAVLGVAERPVLVRQNGVG